jgi:signal transduction histidine kinase
LRRWRSIPLLLAVATLIPIGALGWLGLRILRQQDDIERQRRRESLEVAGGRLALAIDRWLTQQEERLSQASGIRLTPTRIDTSAGVVLLYQPQTVPVDDLQALVFAEAEKFEFQSPDLPKAAYLCRNLANSPDTSVRAAALIRLGRVLRKLGDTPAALQAYAHLQQLGSAMVAGQPAELLARLARCRLLAEFKDGPALRQEANAFATALYSHTWPIDAATFDLYCDLLNQWGAPPPPAGARARTNAAIALWGALRAGDLPPRGRRVLKQSGALVFAVWTGGPDSRTVWLATPPEFESALRPLSDAEHLAASVSDLDGQPLFGAPSAGSISLSPGETHLPFILRVAPIAEPAADTYRLHRRLLISGLLLTFALMLVVSYGLYRVTAREMALARQQSDFVSAVSHEFRTPLTSMRHLTDLLVSRGVTSEERKAHYYELLAGETERLQRMVESLLSFGRMEAGAYALHLTEIDAKELASNVVQEFRQEALARGRQVLCRVAGALPTIRADRDALSRALWNLLENAVKYSDAGTAVEVFARRDGHRVMLGVTDQGHGISPAEQKKVFQKFVRSEEAQRRGIRGVGIGLALVKRIVEAHGGSVELLSQPGKGSTFTLVLPCHES